MTVTTWQIIIVHDLEVEGQQHLVEVGASDPTFRPIPLDFVRESPAYRESLWTHKLFRTPEGHIRRFNKPMEDSPDETLYEDYSWQDGWKIISEIDPKSPRDINYFQESMSHDFHALLHPNLKFFRKGMYYMVYTNGRMVYFRDYEFYLKVGDGEADRHVTSSSDQLIAKYRKYMPTIPPDLVLAGINITGMQFPPESKITRMKLKGSKPSRSKSEIEVAK